MSRSPRLMLASASPRRSELLRNAGIKFEVSPAHIDEGIMPGEEPLTYAKRLARQKARAIHNMFPDVFVLGADTVVIVDGVSLGKPADAADAARMLRLLRGRSHEVTTGVCLIGSDIKKTFEDVRS